MTGRDVPDNEMLYFPWQTRPDVRAIEALLSGDCTPADAPAGLLPAAEVLAALRGPADLREVAGWGQALVAFRELAGHQEGKTSPARRQRRRSRLIAALLGAKLAAVGVGVAMAAVLGSGIAAYTGSLPAVLQKFAHDTIGAPGVHTSKPRPTPQRPPVGPSATGSAVHGLCNAYEHGDADKRSVAFRNLAAAAGGAGKVTAYCSQPAHGTTGSGSHGSPGSSSRRTGQVRPSAHPAHGRKPAVPPGAVSHGHGTGHGHGPGKK